METTFIDFDNHLLFHNDIHNITTLNPNNETNKNENNSIVGDVNELLTSLLSMEEDDYTQNQDHQEAEAMIRITGTEESPPPAKRQRREENEIPQRRIWVKDRSKAWWDECDRPHFPDAEFKRAFRMSKSTFHAICHRLDSALTKKDTILRAAIPLRQRVAVCLWRLATGDPLRVVSTRFGLGISTCHKLVIEVCTAINTVLMPELIRWPENFTANRDGFESISGIPNLCGSIHTTHVPIIAPKGNVGAYFNKKHTERNHKTSYTMTLQGVVDHKGIFTDVSIGWPGSMSDEQILKKSNLYDRAKKGVLMNDDLWVAGDLGFPFLDWLVVPYSHPNLTWTQHVMNQSVEAATKVAKAAFGRLKGRWGCLRKRTEGKLQDLPVVFGACCVLHNICETMGEEMDEEMKLDEVFEYGIDVAEGGIQNSCGGNASMARDRIAHDLLHRRGLADTGFL